ncbi:hypothetical protein [Acinetobacter modestus]|uniref:hypothetical protein n=1 Tax=Acinetobacter modestus TaxID=1776740 RepID=UPI001F4A6222|nr:hypothetical protein [Acinetobacter modestus]MCH7330806.1 hypothetical protein [Acinetobacter modestus]
MNKVWIAIVLSSVASLGHATQQAFLIQNSGWMEPFYQDQNSEFKPLINGVIQTVSKPDDKIVVSVFNQSNALAKSPKIIYQGAGAKPMLADLQAQQIAYKNDKAYADTDFTEAVVSTITEPFAKQSGIIWIFTNNKNSPNNDAETIARNKEFYTLIHDNPAINKVLAFPLKMPVNGQHFNASGLMVYALAYGQSAEKDLNQLVESGQIAKIFTQQPALLKPLDKEPVQIIPQGVKNSSSIRASLSQDHKVLIFDLEPKKVAPEIKLTADLKNNFYPYNIAATKVEAKLMLANEQQAPIQISQTQVNLLTKENTKLEFNLPIPADMVVSPWSWTAFKAMGKQVIIPAQVQVTLYEQQLTLSDQFKQSLQDLFPNDPLSDVFVAPGNIQSSIAIIPVQFRLQYPLWSVMVMMAGILLGIFSVIFLFAFSSKSKRYEVLINGVKKQSIQLKPFSTQNIYGENAKIIAVAKRGLSKPTLEILDKDIIITIR